MSTNVYSFHLRIAADQWAVMEKFDDPGGGPGNPGNGGGRGGLQGGGGRGPGNNGPPPAMEYQKGAAALEFEGRPLGAIQVRFKGQSSFRFACNSLKRSLKLDFNGVEQGRTFFGLTRLNLNNNAMDPSQLREAVAYDVRQLLAEDFNAGRLFPLIDAMAAAIRPSLAGDRMVSAPRFEAAVSAATPLAGGGVESGRGGPGRPRAPLKAFVTERSKSVLLQLEGRKTGFAPRDLRPGPGGPGPAGGPRSERPK